MDTKQLIYSKLKQGILSESQMALWVDVLNYLSEESLQDIWEFLVSDETAVSVLTENLLAKESAIRNADVQLFEQVLKKDEAFINLI
jgi:hypothetical protein